MRNEGVTPVNGTRIVVTYPTAATRKLSGRCHVASAVEHAAEGTAARDGFAPGIAPASTGD
ncbi:hypothetical protein [Burkholderia territorii]|uniref:hypothetical protein n=1 Tax=Burkholderia territorii TaxID=1503055 RepID=UPI000B1C06EE|nr:hypothetical protein [Burkholderia territorii]